MQFWPEKHRLRIFITLTFCFTKAHTTLSDSALRKTPSSMPGRASEKAVAWPLAHVLGSNASGNDGNKEPKSCVIRNSCVNLQPKSEPNENTDMEQHQDDTLMKSRTVGACVSTALRLFGNNFRKSVRHAWPYALAYALAGSALGTFWLTSHARMMQLAATATPDAASSLATMAIVGVMLAVVVWLCLTLLMGSGVTMLRQHSQTGAIIAPRRLFHFDANAQWLTLKASLFMLVVVALTTAATAAVATVAARYLGGVTAMVASAVATVVALCFLVTWSYPVMLNLMATNKGRMSLPVAGYATGLRHYALLFGVALLALIVAAVASLFVSMPAVIVGMATLQAENGAVAGDPIGMPQHFTILVAATLFLTHLVIAWFVLALLFMAYYAYGSVEQQESEIKQLKATTAI